MGKEGMKDVAGFAREAGIRDANNERVYTLLTRTARNAARTASPAVCIFAETRAQQAIGAFATDNFGSNGTNLCFGCCETRQL